jgi:alpha-ribazole phosphatase CobZ
VESVKVEYNGEARALIADLGGERTVVSSLHGVRRSRFIAVRYVDKSFTCSDVRVCSERAAAELGLPRETPVFFTAVRAGEYVEARAPGVSLLATVGLSDVACVGGLEGEVFQPPPKPSTVIVVVSVEGLKLRLEGLLDLYRTVSEAKAVALLLMLAGACRGRGAPVGTPSDAVAVAAPVSDDGLKWAGPATTIGWRAARLVVEALRAGDGRGDGGRAVEGLGLSWDELLEDLVSLYSSAPTPNADLETVRGVAEAMLSRLTVDPNVSSLLLAAGLLDAAASLGLIPGLSAEEYAADTARLVADELLAVALADYVNGFRGILATYWADRSKRRLGLKLANLPAFTDDMAAALAASTLSKIYDKLLGTEPQP